jgi:broad specificity phosphatase PhoE
MASTLFFITHPEVVIDRQVPITSWSLSELGRQRMRAFVAQGELASLRRLYCSAERKALEAAACIAERWAANIHVVPELGEVDRSSTGFIEPSRFEQAADQCFAQPEESFQGWETARAAQQRIVAAVEKILGSSAAGAAGGDVAIVSHGAVGALYKCHLKGVPITRREDQARQGNYFRVELPSRRLLGDWVALPEVGGAQNDSL